MTGTVEIGGYLRQLLTRYWMEIYGNPPCDGEIDAAIAESTELTKKDMKKAKIYHKCLPFMSNAQFFRYDDRIVFIIRETIEKHGRKRTLVGVVRHKPLSPAA